MYIEQYSFHKWEVVQVMSGPEISGKVQVIAQGLIKKLNKRCE